MAFGFGIGGALKVRISEELVDIVKHSSYLTSRIIPLFDFFPIRKVSGYLCYQHIKECFPGSGQTSESGIALDHLCQVTILGVFVINHDRLNSKEKMLYSLRLFTVSKGLDGIQGATFENNSRENSVDA